jgi:hypothetical protein
MAIKLNTASGSVTLTAEDGAGGASVSIPRAGVLAPDGDGSSLTGINAITDTSELTDVTVASADPESVSNVPAAGHLWINKVSGEAFICTDATTGANAFYNIGEGTGGVVPPVPWGDRGVFAGGYGYSNVMDYISIATPANAVDFGDLISAKGQLASVSNGSRGVFGGSTGGSGEEMEYITIATTGNATDFGDMVAFKYGRAGVSDASRGVFGGGASPYSNAMDYITIATTGNATNFGTLTQSRATLGAVNGGGRGVFCGGATATNIMDYITIATTGNATDFGDMLAASYRLSGCSNGSRGCLSGHNKELIEYITIATTGNATDFGDLQSGAAWDRYMMGATSDGSKGLFGGGGNTWSQIDAITIATTGNATDFGDLTVNRRELAATSGD